MLHEFERIALQKIALQKLNSSDLGVTTRIPKGKLLFLITMEIDNFSVKLEIKHEVPTLLITPDYRSIQV